jgi:hypothetical protein
VIRDLSGRHAGATVAVIGSAPSAVLFDPSQCDVSIGVNGAARLGPRFDYYLCADVAAPSRSWFQLDCAHTRVVATTIASMDLFLYPAQDHRDLQRRAVEWTQQDELALPEPAPPHRVYRMAAPNPERLAGLRKRDTDVLLVYATVAGQAVQLAYLLGADRLRLFGCAFTIETSGTSAHYYYQDATGGTGSIRDSQLRQMDRYLALLREQGVRVVAHGPTRLTELDEHLTV